MIASVPVTPRDVLVARQRNGWKPDGQGRLIVRPRGLLGPAYVVETVEQLRQVETYERTKMIWVLIVAGAALGSVLTMQRGDLATAIESVLVVLLLVACLVGHARAGGSQVATPSAMRTLGVEASA